MGPNHQGCEWVEDGWGQWGRVNSKENIEFPWNTEGAVGFKQKTIDREPSDLWDARIKGEGCGWQKEERKSCRRREKGGKHKL